jgi:hypothetical protein
MKSVRAAGSPAVSWSDVIGPVYTDAQVEKLLGASNQDVAVRVKGRTLLGLHTGDRQVVYPVFQFVDGDATPGLSEILELTVGQVDDWTLASWLVAEQPSLGRSVIDYVSEQGVDDKVLAVVRHAADRWSH